MTPQGHLADLRFAGFTERDLRFTRSRDGEKLFVIALGWPESGRILVRSLASDHAVETVCLLGHEGSIAWTQTDAGLEVTLPSTAPCDHAIALCLTGRGLMRSP